MSRSFIRAADEPEFVFDFRRTGDIDHYSTLSNKELRAQFLVEGLFSHGKTHLVMTDLDRAIVGSVVPLAKPLSLAGAEKFLASKTFLERRELGIINVGAAGSVTAAGETRKLQHRDSLYLGLGAAAEITFTSESATDPALFYLISYPAHAQHPTTHMQTASATVAAMGVPEQANVRKINKLIHPGGAKSCQLVMGYTELASGSVWNTMPPHVHERRTEIYLYFALGEADRTFHFMGTPDDTRSLVVANLQVVLSPSWSIHCACGTRAYTFVWAMGGENQDFSDVVPSKIADLK